ncbi:MAG: ATP-dependent Clp protease adaptor ClpS [Planctomycetaceae bacterium]|jgi:ATP-dependent Clp protease adaptor protein ClpS|nr:ATP-dependent Clp protease adaptor ClpS [Planctomycetaceae bacterium]
MPVFDSIDEKPDTDVMVRPKNSLRKNQKPKKEPRFNVILWNDEVHTFDYVIIMLGKVFGYSVERGMAMAMEVHHGGRAAVFTSTLEQAEIKRDMILGFGPDPLLAESDCSIVATLERVPEED